MLESIRNLWQQAPSQMLRKREPHLHCFRLQNCSTKVTTCGGHSFGGLLTIPPVWKKEEEKREEGKKRRKRVGLAQ